MTKFKTMNQDNQPIGVFIGPGTMPRHVVLGKTHHLEVVEPSEPLTPSREFIPLDVPKWTAGPITMEFRVDAAAINELFEAIQRIVWAIDPVLIQRASESLKNFTEKLMPISFGCFPPVILPDVPLPPSIDPKIYETELRSIGDILAQVRPSHPLSFPSWEISGWLKIYQIAEEARKNPLMSLAEHAERFTRGGTVAAKVFQEEQIISRKETSRSELVDKIPVPKTYKRNRFKQ